MFDKKIGRYLGVGMKTEGDLGIEVEVECDKVFSIDSTTEKVWALTTDGSLRGHSGEFVLIKPCFEEQLPEYLDMLKTNMSNFKSKINSSIRAGVHVHVNCQKLSVKEMLNLAILYYILETPITKYCGENRSGNLFCLRLKDAEFPLTCIENAIESNSLRSLRTDNIRYAALNFSSLFRYGSLEFRAMATRPDLSGIEELSAILLRLRDYVKDTDRDMRTIPEEFSFAGPKEWARGILGDRLMSIIEYPEMEDDMYEDLRRVQYIIYMLEEYNARKSDE